ncbi:hypothetical protein J8F10_00245 [Gemmata sp. G18]|uniref:Uncharacterized protein n=1 Tax=Gemmata palustris TaxID=2822762 RepID=A0ABS5BJ72_9BACT|nr:hypothetical protein [Gemmata palustris]MBP3953730.1 hypothetical protein [Gemmata palustris]
MATEMVEVDLVVMVDADGNFEIGTDTDDLKTRWEENIAELAPNATRMVAVKVKVPKPKVVELEAEIAEEPSETELKTA